MAFLTITELKNHLNLVAAGSAFDTWLTDVIPVVEKYIEGETGRTLTQYSTLSSPASYFAENFQEWGKCLELSKVPFLSVSSITYIDLDGNQQVWNSSKYEVDTEKLFARVFPVYGEAFPVIRNQRNPITVNYDHGYIDGSFPEDLLHAAKMIVASLFQNREDDSALTLKKVPIGADRLLAPYKILKV